MQLPTIHDNGTGKEALVNGYNRAWEDLQLAHDTLKRTAPNPRDYPTPEAFEQANREHMRRLGQVIIVIDEIGCLLNDIENL